MPETASSMPGIPHTTRISTLNAKHPRRGTDSGALYWKSQEESRLRLHPLRQRSDWQHIPVNAGRLIAAFGTRAALRHLSRVRAPRAGRSAAAFENQDKSPGESARDAAIVNDTSLVGLRKCAI